MACTSLWLSAHDSTQLADFANFTQPWSIDPSYIPADIAAEKVVYLTAFKNTTQDVPILLEELERTYCQLSDQPYPIKEMIFVRSWMIFRVGINWSPFVPFLM